VVRLVGTHLDDEVIEELHESGVHPRLRVKLPASVIPYSYDRLGEAMVGADLVVVGVNSLGVEWASMMLGQVLAPETPVLMLTKGLEGDGERLHLLPDILRGGLPAAVQSSVKIAAIGGPSIAGELAVRRHTSVVITGQDQGLLDRLVSLLRTPYYHVWTNSDFIGVEVSVAMKNVYALAVGIVGGLLEKDGTGADGYVMHNLAAAIFAQGLGEMAYMVEVMGGQRATVLGLPGAGDLYVTSMGGRNGRMGRWLGLGHHYIDAKKKQMAAETIEGAELALAIGPTVEKMVYEGQLEGRRLPLLRTMIQVVCNDAIARIPWDDFFA
jgi:glycerol-3-phosphate dehydrogenase (NAD(P)+)